MSAQDSPQSPETAPEPRDGAVTPERSRKSLSVVRKACTALVMGALLLTTAGFAFHGVSDNAVDASYAQSQSLESSSGTLPSHVGSGKGGSIGGTKAVTTASVKAVPANVPVAAQQAQSERIASISVPRLWGDSTRFVVEGASDANLGSPGTDNPNAVADFETAIAHNTGTQLLGDLGNVALEGHRTANTFGRLNTLQHGDTISVTDAKTGTVYTYAVTKTMQDNPDIQKNPKTHEIGLPYTTAVDQDKASSVMDPIPFDDNSWSAPGHPAKTQPKQRLLTMTSCGLDYETSRFWRIYVIAELQSVTPAK